MTASLLIGTGQSQVYRYAGSHEPVLTELTWPRPSFLLRHRDHLYAVSEIAAGQVTRFAGGAEPEPISSGGAAPCHLAGHPQEPWIYVSNYGSGTVRAIEVTASGEFTGTVVDLPHTGSGPVTDRQEASHAHFSAIIGDYLVVADLGSDQLRAYRCRGGRPDPTPVLTDLPPGTGPRHFVRHGDELYVAGELSGEVLAVSWQEGAGRGSVRARVPASQAPGAHYLAHISAVEDALIVGVRGANTICVLAVPQLQLLGEVPTVAWPRHHAVTDDHLVVAGERGDAIAWHPLVADQGRVEVGDYAHTLAVPTPMCIVAEQLQ